ncbi:MAG TPA: type II toxin-antitoxin system death-on-curing family toxin [Patescibacteria group bacterium]|nr:type II toxin-antitoxin system death-on-curing family toxin [Patescibacteria group bacterium]
MDIIYLTLEQIILVHEDQIDRYGGSHGIRELSLLESAVFRPQTTFSNHDLYPTIFEKAAALIHALANNHAFIDGNKRTAAVCMIIFLSKNRYELTATQNELVDFMLDLVIKKFNIEQIAKWLKNNSRRSI